MGAEATPGLHPLARILGSATVCLLLAGCGATQHSARLGLHGGKVTTIVKGKQLNCFESPSTGTAKEEACGYPGLHNTGPGGEGAAKCAGYPSEAGKTISSSGEVREKEFTSKLTISATNVTLNDVCVIVNGENNYEGGAAQGIVISASKATVENSVVEGKNATNESLTEAITSENSTSPVADNDYLANCSDCLMDDNWTAENDFIWANGLPYSEGYSGGKGKGERAHAESLYCNNCTASMNHDTFILPQGQTATTIFAATNEQIGGGGACSNKLSVTNSFMVGGGFLIYECGNGSSVGTASLTFTGNDVARCTTTPLVEVTSEQGDGGSQCKGDKTYTTAEPLKDADSHGFYPYGGFYGTASYTYCEASSTNWSGNHWDDNGAPLGC